MVSVPGRRFEGDSKITDLLYLCHAHLKYGVSYESIFELIEQLIRGRGPLCLIRL